MIVEREILKDVKQNHLGFIPEKANSLLTVAAATYFVAQCIEPGIWDAKLKLITFFFGIGSTVFVGFVYGFR